MTKVAEKEFDDYDFWPALELQEGDGVMVLVYRRDGAKEVHFPQLGLLTEGRIEQCHMDMYRGLIRARAEEHRQQQGLTTQAVEDEDDGA